MAIDEELLSRSQAADAGGDSAGNAAPVSDRQNEEEQDETADRAGSLRAAVQAQKAGLPPDSTGDLRADRKRAQRQQGASSKINKAVKAALSPARKALSGLLKAAWENLITSFGTTLVWIDIHVFMNKIGFEALFCDLGEEWLPEKPETPVVKGDSADQSGPAEEAAKSVGLVEKMGCCCVNFGCFLLVLSVLVLISLILKVIENPMSALGAILSYLWELWTG